MTTRTTCTSHTLRPGARVVRRGDGMLQVGLGPDRAAVVPDTPSNSASLAALAAGTPGGRSPGGGASAVAARDDASDRLLAALATRDLLVDGEALRRDLGRCTGPEARATVAAAWAEHGSATPEVRRRRGSTPVAVSGDPAASRRAADLLAGHGLPVRSDAALRLHVAVGEPDRELVDVWLRKDRPHLIVRCVEGRVTVGPFTVPGGTACLRCIDAVHAETDPRRPLVLRQYAGRCPDDPVRPEPVPADLMDLAVSWAVRDLTRWVEGHRPRSWSATVDVDPALELTVTRWSPHPACGCAWQQLFAG